MKERNKHMEGSESLKGRECMRGTFKTSCTLVSKIVWTLVCKVVCDSMLERKRIIEIPDPTASALLMSSLVYAMIYLPHDMTVRYLTTT